MRCERRSERRSERRCVRRLKNCLRGELTGVFSRGGVFSKRPASSPNRLPATLLCQALHTQRRRRDRSPQAAGRRQAPPEWCQWSDGVVVWWCGGVVELSTAPSGSELSLRVDARDGQIAAAREQQRKMEHLGGVAGPGVLLHYSTCASKDWPELSSPVTSYPSCQCSFRPQV